MDFKEVILKDGGGDAISPVTIAQSIYRKDGTSFPQSIDDNINGVKTALESSISAVQNNMNTSISNIIDGTTVVGRAKQLNSSVGINGVSFNGTSSIATTSYVNTSLDNYYTIVSPPAKGAMKVLNIRFKGQSSIYMSQSPSLNTLVFKISGSSGNPTMQFYPATSEGKNWALATSTSTTTDTTYYMLLIGC